jgi:hypothetical protein
MRHSTGRHGTWRGEDGAGNACPDTETLPVLRGPTPDCAVRYVRGSMRRLRRNGAACSQHGACGSEMEQEEGGRFRLVIASSGLFQPPARSNERLARQHRKSHGDIGDGRARWIRRLSMRYGKASPAFWQSNATAPSCTRTWTARTRWIRRIGLKPLSLAGRDWGFRSNSGSRHGKRGLSNVRGGRGTASRTVGLLGAIFTYAIRHGMRSDNPVHGVMRPVDGRRERRLSDDEYAALGAGPRQSCGREAMASSDCSGAVSGADRLAQW